MAPPGVIIPIRPGLANCANQTLPSGPGVMSRISPFGARPEENSVIAPVPGVRRPIALAPLVVSVNQRLPSAAAVGVIEFGSLFTVGVGNSVITPSVVMRATSP